MQYFIEPSPHHRTARPRLYRFWLRVAGALLLTGLLAWPVLAWAADRVWTVSQPVSAGMLVSIDGGAGTMVEPATTDNLARLAGVAAPVLRSPSDQSVAVVREGPARALVSDLAGPVKAGDRITASPIAGVGMKAAAGAVTVGVAQADLDTDSADAIRKSIGTARGPRTAVIGVVPVMVQLDEGNGTGSGLALLVPSGLQSVFNIVGGGSVSPGRVLASCLLLLLALVLGGVIVTSSIRHGLTAIGRNPLSRHAILGGLTRSLLAATGIMALAVGATYLLIRS